MALNWDHKQVLAIIVMNDWVSQIQAKIFTREITTQMVRAVRVSSSSYISNLMFMGPCIIYIVE